MPFRQEVGWSALRARAAAGFDTIPFPRETPVSVSMTFYFTPPKKMPKGRTLPVVKPDLSKLLRSTEDALTGVLWADDCQVVRAHISKEYHETPHALVTVEECQE